VDCGTNSVRLLVADVVGADLLELDRRMTIVRLGEGVDATGSFAPAALQRTFTALREFAQVTDRLGARRLRMVATSASRDVRNRTAFVDGVRAVLGVEPDVITGAEEARLSYLGATAALGGTAASPRLVYDIGGGSTELVLGDDDGVLASCSVDIGCVRLTERHVRHDPPTAEEVAAVLADVDAALTSGLGQLDLATRLGAAEPSLVGVAGTVTTASALAHGLATYDSQRIHGSVLTAEQVGQVSDRLLAMTHQQRAALGPMHPGRVDVIAVGVLILRRILALTGASRTWVSERDILDGIALELGTS
jgi:exopolyphosphatase/guanosine-5'-triphosphate,3'-diphosphate pyrophosphatase